MNFNLSEEEVHNYMNKVKEGYKKDEIEFDQFARCVAIILEDA